MRQAETHSLAFFQLPTTTDYKHWGTQGVQEQSVVEWSNTKARKPPGGASNAGWQDWRIADSANWPLSPFLYSTLVQILLTTDF